MTRTRGLIHDSQMIDRMVSALAEPDGGFTVDPWTGDQAAGGYAVSIHPDDTMTTAGASAGDILEFLLTRAATLTLAGRVFGGWHDPSDGRIYLDVSVMVRDRDEALRLARRYDQLAVWDFEAGMSIPTYLGGDA